MFQFGATGTRRSSPRTARAYASASHVFPLPLIPERITNPRACVARWKRRSVRWSMRSPSARIAAAIVARSVTSSPRWVSASRAGSTPSASRISSQGSALVYDVRVHQERLLAIVEDAQPGARCELEAVQAAGRLHVSRRVDDGLNVGRPLVEGVESSAGVGSRPRPRSARPRRRLAAPPGDEGGWSRFCRSASEAQSAATTWAYPRLLTRAGSHGPPRGGQPGTAKLSAPVPQASVSRVPRFRHVSRVRTRSRSVSGCRQPQVVDVLRPPDLAHRSRRRGGSQRRHPPAAAYWSRRSARWS